LELENRELDHILSYKNNTGMSIKRYIENMPFIDYTIDIRPIA